MNKRQLILEDGTIFIGEAFGSKKNNVGEVVFFTGMTGYQEVITDPNFSGKIVTMTYPSVGNYGINRDDIETLTPYMSGIIVKEICHEPSNFRSEETLDQFLIKHNIPGISGIDTRMLTQLLRKKGTLKGMMTDVEANVDEVISHLQQKDEKMLVKETSITRPYIVPGRGFRIAIVDLGMKHSILHELTERNCYVTVVPYHYSAEEVLQYKPDGILFSNGPGNPEMVPQTIEMIKSLLGKVPLFGIGLGHQLFAIACGAKIDKLHVGNYGTNFPVKDLKTGQSWITTQSRHYYVKESSIGNDLSVTFRSLNDGTVEGLEHKFYPAFSVQFNPEGAPGSNETNYLFDEFLKIVEQNRDKQGDEQNA